MWGLAAVPQPAEPGGARAVLWLTGWAGGGSSAGDDGLLSDLGVGEFSLGKWKTSWRPSRQDSCRSRGGLHPVSTRAGAVQPSPQSG